MCREDASCPFVHDAPCVYRSYVMSAQEKQSKFTGREQRLGVWILSFLLAGIFDRGQRKPDRSTGGEDDARAAAASRAADATAADPASCEGGADDGAPSDEDDHARVLLRGLWGGGRSGEGAPCPGDEEEVRAGTNDGATDPEHTSAVHSKARFDWAAYREAIPTTPPHAEITAMFSECALLVGRITRHLGDAVASTMTLAEGAANAKQAQEFVLLYPVPILGPLHTTKALKLLAHLLDAVRLHGSILNGDTSLNEQEHKKDKRHYVRTDKGTWSFLRQVVRHANGSRGVLRLNKEADAVRSAPCAGPGDDEDVSSDGASDGNEAEDKGPGAPEAGAGAEVADAAATAAPHRIANAPSNDLAAQVGSTAAAGMPRPSAASLRQVPNAHLASLPGLSGVGGVLLLVCEGPRAGADGSLHCHASPRWVCRAAACASDAQVPHHVVVRLFGLPLRER